MVTKEEVMKEVYEIIQLRNPKYPTTTFYRGIPIDKFTKDELVVILSVLYYKEN